MRAPCFCWVVDLSLPAPVEKRAVRRASAGHPQATGAPSKLRYPRGQHSIQTPSPALAPLASAPHRWAAPRSHADGNAVRPRCSPHGAVAAARGQRRCVPQLGFGGDWRSIAHAFLACATSLHRAAASAAMWRACNSRSTMLQQWRSCSCRPSHPQMSCPPSNRRRTCTAMTRSLPHGSLKHRTNIKTQLGPAPHPANPSPPPAGQQVQARPPKNSPAPAPSPSPSRSPTPSPSPSPVPSPIPSPIFSGTNMTLQVWVGLGRPWQPQGDMSSPECH